MRFKILIISFQHLQDHFKRFLSIILVVVVVVPFKTTQKIVGMYFDGITSLSLKSDIRALSFRILFRDKLCHVLPSLLQMPRKQIIESGRP